MTKADDQWFLTGLIGWGEGCARPGFPGVNTRVAAFEDWINFFDGGVPETSKSEERADYSECDSATQSFVV